MSSFTSHNNASAPDEPYMSKNEILEELGFQKLMLETLDPAYEDYEPTKALIIQEVEKLQTRLAAIKQKKKAASDVPLQGPFKLAAASSTKKKSSGSPRTSSHKAATPGAIKPNSFKPCPSSSTQPSLKTFNKNDYGSIDPYSDTLPMNNTRSKSQSSMDPFSSPYSAPAEANILKPSHNHLPHRNISNNMKRSIDESVGLDIKEESESKSRRTSPGSSGPKPTYKTDSWGFVLLDDSDEEDVVQQQRKVFERAERDRKDHMLAQKMQSSYTRDFSSSRPQPAPASANAFHKLMGSNSSSQSPAAFDNGSRQAQNGSIGKNSSSVIPEVVNLDFDNDDDDFQMISSRPVASIFKRPSAPVPGSCALGQTWQNTGVARSQRPGAFTPYTPSSYTTQAGMPYQLTQGPYSSQSLAQNSSTGGVLQPSAFSGMGATWEDPMEIADRNNLSFGQRADLETYCLDPKRTKTEIENLLANITPEMEIPKADREGTPEGLRFTLYEHQKVALTWLKRQETGSNKGGILADDMGLGKTISTIALILSRPSENRLRRTTLIVAPVALLRQWEKEVKDKLEPSHRMSVFFAHGSVRKRYDEMRNYDIVLTSYGTLGSEFKKLDDLHKRKLMHPEMVLNTDGLPFLGTRSKWYRVVLDEAQNVKNKETKSAKAVQALQAEHRWCLTGTPMMNGVHELFSLIKFLRIPPYNDPHAFNVAFGLLRKGTGSEKALATAMRRLQALLRSILMRRTKKSTIDGKPLIELPLKTEEVIHAIFDEDQQAYYTALETSSKVTFNKFLKAGTVGKNYSNVLVLLLRLRQAACHPHMIMDLEAQDSNFLGLGLGSADMATLAATIKPDVAARLKESDGFECPVCYDALLNPILTLDCCHHICSECLVKITSIVGAIEGDKAKCPSCRADIDNNKCVDWTTFQEVHMGKKKDEEEVDYSDSDSDSGSDSDAISDAGDEDTGADVDSHGDLRDFIVDDDDLDDGFVSRKVLSKKKKKQVVPKCRPYVDDSDAESDNDVADLNDATDDDSDAEPKTEAKAEDSEDGKPNKQEESPDDDYLPELPLEVMERIKKAKEEQPAYDFLPETPSEAKASGIYPAKMEHITQKVTAEAEAKAVRRAARKEKRKVEKASKRKRPKENEKAPHKHLNLATLKKEASKNAEGRRKYMRYLRKNFVSSAKIDKLMELLLATPRDVKTIVFSQFTTLLDLCEVSISESSIEVGRYDGSMRADMRHAAVEAFQGGNTQVLLVSLKAGNAGLNLVAGSQVVILDPFWNPYVEMQAVDRAHRIGQQRPVTVHRILVKGTVEDRIIALQERKRKVVDSALDEKSGNAVSKLGIDELKYLFSSDGDARETLIRAPQIPDQTDSGGMGGGQYGAGAGSGLGSALGAGLNAGLGALSKGAGLSSALGAAGRAVANPYLAGIGVGGLGVSSVYGGPDPREEPRNLYHEAHNLMNGGSSSEAASPEPDAYNPDYITFGSNADCYKRNVGGYGARGYGDYGPYGGYN